MTKAIGPILGVVVLLCFSAAVIAAPAQLYGKSIVVSWTETMTLRRVGEQAFRTESIQAMSKIYISDVGRPFLRMTRALNRNSGSSEQVGGAGRNPTGGPRVIQFQGHSLVIVSEVPSGGARRLQIDFDASFGSCAASVIAGKVPGLSTYIGRSMITGAQVEVQSRSASGATCSIKEGNVFAN
jgi:hypothetical protein